MSGYPTKVRELAWDSKSRFLATGGGQEIIIWDFSGKGPSGSKPIVLSAHESFLSFLSYQPNGTLLASADQNGRLCAWNPPTNKQPLALNDLRSTIGKLAWQPKGNLLASGCSTGEIEIWSAETIAR
jgi:WD40 repeat protein